MLKLLRTLFTLIFTLLFSLVLLFGLLVTFFDPNNYKQDIQTQISAITGRNITINGKLSWGFFPNVILVARNITIQNPKGFSAPNLGHIKEIDFSLRTLPLIYANIEIDKIKLVDPNLQLLVNPLGKNNWSADAEIKPTQKPEKDHSVKPKRPFFTLKTISIDNMQVVNGNLQYVNMRDDKSHAIRGINYRGKAALQQWHNDSEAPKSKLPIAALRHISMNGKLTIDKLMLSKITMQDVSAGLSIKKGIIDITPVSAKLYDGSYGSELRIDVSGDQPTLRLAQAISHVQLEKLFHDLGYENKIRGTYQANIQLSTNNIDTLPASLNGTANIIVKDGAIIGVNISHAINMASAFFAKQALPNLTEKNETPFNTMTGAIIIKNGIVSNDDFSLDSGFMTIKGKGQASLITQQISGQLEAVTKGPARGAKSEKLEKALGGSIPLTVTGNFNHYKVRPDFKKIAAAIGKSLLKDADKKLEKIGDKLKGIFQ